MELWTVRPAHIMESLSWPKGKRGSGDMVQHPDSRGTNRRESLAAQMPGKGLVAVCMQGGPADMRGM